MPNPTEVAIIKRDGSISLYSSYASARSNAVDYDLIQIRADLNETIILKDKVDIWIMPGVKLDNPSGVTISDKVNNISEEVHCNIFGYGKIFNSGGYSCINLDNTNSELKIECDLFDTSTGNTVAININSAAKFHLNCNNILSKGPALFLGNSGDIIEDINLNIDKVETGDPSSSSISGTSIVTYSNGFIKINEIICKNRGHCLLHRKGEITAKIKKITTKYSIGSLRLSAVALIQGDQVQKLILYFDEINSIDSYGGIELGQGTGIFIGRKIFSNINSAVHIVGANTKGYIKCNEIISQGGENISAAALDLGNFTSQITIMANYIYGYRDGGVIFINNANVQLKNAKIINTYSGSSPSSVGIFIAGNKIISLINVKIVTGELTNGRTIYYAGPEESIDVKNYGLIVNKAIDSNVSLLIGTEISEPDYNYQYIVDPLLD